VSDEEHSSQVLVLVLQLDEISSLQDFFFPHLSQITISVEELHEVSLKSLLLLVQLEEKESESDSEEMLIESRELELIVF